MCMIGEVVVVGGVRRSALISLSNLTDRRMREAKMGAWYVDNSHRGLANNSVAYTEKPDSETFMEEWLALVRSKSGERGIFNRVAAQEQASKWGRRNSLYTITLENGTTKKYKQNDKVQTQRGELYVWQLTERDSLLDV